MTIATLSFAIPGRVAFRCDELDIDERRDLDASPPFAEWSQLYATGYWSHEALLGIGLAISDWLDGPRQWLARLIRGTAPIILTIETGPHPNPIEKAVLDAPWELLARLEPTTGAAEPVPPRAANPLEPREITELFTRLGPIDTQRTGHLALDPGLQLTTVRRLGPAATPRAPSQFRLSVVFMAAQPDGLAGLAVDREEAAIRRACGSIGMDLAVEESGSLERLGDLVAQTGECDVIQLTCHGVMKDSAVVALEGPLGERVDATADGLSLGIGKKPRLMFLSACSTAGASDVLWSLSTDLCRRGWPAVLGWSCSVSDPGAIALASALYRQLALRVSLAEALAQARVVVANGQAGSEWHKARLFVGPGGGGTIVDSTRARPRWPDPVGSWEFLDNRTRTIQMAPAGDLFPHRRAFQRTMVALRDGTYPGVMVHGGDELGRATFTGRVLRRMEPERPRVVVTRDFDAPAILEAIRVQTASDGVDAIARQFRETLRTDASRLLQALHAIIEGPCQDAGEGAMVLVLHGFDPEPTPSAPPDGRRRLPPEHLVVARALIRAFSGARTASRLLFTSATPFSVPADGGDLTESLLAESLVPGDRTGSAPSNSM